MLDPMFRDTRDVVLDLVGFVSVAISPKIFAFKNKYEDFRVFCPPMPLTRQSKTVKFPS